MLKKKNQKIKNNIQNKNNNNYIMKENNSMLKNKC